MRISGNMVVIICPYVTCVWKKYAQCTFLQVLVSKNMLKLRSLVSENVWLQAGISPSFLLIPTGVLSSRPECLYYICSKLVHKTLFQTQFLPVLTSVSSSFPVTISPSFIVALLISSHSAFDISLFLLKIMGFLTITGVTGTRFDTLNPLDH